jgi:hypothetical protein
MAVIVTAVPGIAERLAAPTVRPAISIYNVYQSGSPNAGARSDREFRGYAPGGAEVITSVPGVLLIDPGHRDVNGNGKIEPAGEMWRNYVLAAQVGVPYSIKNVTLVKLRPTQVQCSEVFSDTPVSQQGTANIRTWWPLFYEAPGTTWTLTILYGTYQAWDDDGTGPNKPGYVHCEIWQWVLDADLSSLRRTLELFHELPFGASGAPLVSDEPLYASLRGELALARACLNFGDTAGAGMALMEFELAVSDSCIGLPPLVPNTSGVGTGIAQSTENPSACKLLVDTEYVARKLGIFQAVK